MQGDFLREKFKNKELIIGTHITAPEPINIEIMCKAGFDVIWIDWEHGPMDRKDINLMIMGVRTTKSAVFVRVPNNDEEYVKPALEMGVDGITGSIEPGKEADLCILKENPFDNISNLSTVYKVAKGGRLFDSAQLRETAVGMMK